MKVDAIHHRRIFDDTTRVMQEFRKEMFRNIDYVDGIQYTSEDQRYLLSQKRIPTVWNMVLPQILAFMGAEEANRMATRVHQVENSDAEMATVLNYLLEQDNYETNASYEISKAATHAAIMRYGALMPCWEPTYQHPDGGYVLRALDPRDVWWDYHPSEPDFDKSEYIIYSRWFTPEHLINRFVTDPDKKKELRERGKNLVGTDSLETPYSIRYTSSNAWMQRRQQDLTTYGRTGTSMQPLRYHEYYDRGLFRCIELHERREHQSTFLYDGNAGEYIPIPDDMVDNKEFIKATLEWRGLEYNSNAIIKHSDYQMWLSVSAPHLDPKELLVERPYPVQGKGFAIKIIPGYNMDPDRGKLRSLVDHLIDPQDVINRAHSARAHLMSKILNPDIILGPLGIDDEKDLAALKSQIPGKILHAHDPSHIIYKSPDMGGINLFLQEAQIANQSMEEMIGTNKAMKGIRQSEDSALMMTKRAGYSEAMLKPYWDNIAQTIEKLENFHLGLIQSHMTQKRMLRVLEPNHGWTDYGFVNEYNELTGEFKNDVTVGRYDVKLDTDKYTKSERQMELDKLFAMFGQSDPEMRLTLAPAMLELVELPQMQEIVESAKLQAKRQMLRTQVEIQALQQQLDNGQIQQALLPKTAELQANSVNLQNNQVILNTIMTEVQKLQAAMQLNQTQQQTQQQMQPTPQEQLVQQIPPNVTPSI